MIEKFSKKKDSSFLNFIVETGFSPEENRGIIALFQREVCMNSLTKSKVFLSILFSLSLLSAEGSSDKNYLHSVQFELAGIGGAYSFNYELGIDIFKARIGAGLYPVIFEGPGLWIPFALYATFPRDKKHQCEAGAALANTIVFDPNNTHFWWQITPIIGYRGNYGDHLVFRATLSAYFSDTWDPFKAPWMGLSIGWRS